MGATFNLVITGRKGRVVLADPKTGKYGVVEDASPQVMQYLDARHAAMEADRLSGLLQSNPSAAVEVRPPTLADDAVGKKMPLSEWVAQCAKSPLPPASGAAPAKDKYVSQIDTLLAEVAELKNEEAAAHAE